MNVSTRRCAVLTAFLLLGIPLGCSTTAPPPEEKAPPATVKWEAPVIGALEEWVELIGTTIPAPDRLAKVTAPIEGRVVSVFGDSTGTPILEGQRIEKGTALVQLDSTVVQANLAKAAAAQEVLLEEQKQAQFAVELASSEVERLKQLKTEEEKNPSATRSLVSPVDRLKAEYALKDAQSKLKAAQGRIVAGIKEQESLQAQLKLHTLSAPMSGRVGRIQVVRGQTLSVGTVVTELVDLEQTIDVLCYVPPSLVNQLQLGFLAISSGLDAEPAASPAAEGQVVYIADQAEPETGNFAVKVRFANNEAHLRANKVQRIRIQTKPGRECLNIRESAIQADEENATVVIVVDIKTAVNAEGKAETTGIARRVKVETGMRDRTLHQIEILSLDDPEKDPQKRWSGNIREAFFVVEGGQGLQTGDTVKLDVDVD
ncbi:efflux RND transporter periplasmic adaptor subunit [Telmatocola sphagniphila]|uniref:Efflux RND transporter periplasmic adaptor subunit n=1 Tax=Telmatocola sphagniphila TaxID=1123043 RepID=A0A8E6EZC1_9BACT|nr:efflux RND transporter periplasmic adaptor subunit [Telmatocola sphagniphila]QVL33593.1 efflux RND transporter periplasmic adaptor subunit [Telmatocola sphagniphila]